MNAARYDGTAPTSPTDATLRRRLHLGESVADQGRPGGATGPVVGDVGNDVGAQVATFHLGSGTDQGLQRRGRDDERVGDVLVPQDTTVPVTPKGQLC